MNWWPFKPRRQANVNPQPVHARPPMPPGMFGWQPRANPIPQPDPDTRSYRGQVPPYPLPPSPAPAPVSLAWPVIDPTLIPLKED